MSWYLHACPSCGGDLYDSLEGPDWVACLLCGRQFRKAKLGVLGAHRMNGARSHGKVSMRRSLHGESQVEELERAA